MRSKNAFGGVAACRCCGPPLPSSSAPPAAACRSGRWSLRSGRQQSSIGQYDTTAMTKISAERKAMNRPKSSASIESLKKSMYVGDDDAGYAAIGTAHMTQRMQQRDE